MEGKQIGKSKKSPAEKKEGEKTLYWESNQSKVEMEWNMDRLEWFRTIF